MSKPKFSVITVCYNAEATLSATMASVLSQDYPDVEYIVVDGASTDRTPEIIRSFPPERITLICEKDEGLYDAINKGIAKSTGDLIAILHADDVFADSAVLSSIAALFAGESRTDAVSASVSIFRAGASKPFRYYNATHFRPWQFRLGMQPPHPGFFVTREAFDRVGFYRTTYRISSDFDWLLRAILIVRLNVVYSSVVVVHMRDGGISSSGWKSRKRMNNENLKILKSHGIYSNKLMIYLKYFWKVFQLRGF